MQGYLILTEMHSSDDALIQRSSTIDKKERSSVVQFSRKCILSALPSWQRGETGNFLSWVNLPCKTFTIDFLFIFSFPSQNPGIQFIISRPVPGKRIGTGNASILYSFAHFLCEIDPLYPSRFPPFLGIASSNFPSRWKILFFFPSRNPGMQFFNFRSLPVKREYDFQFPFPFPGAKKPFPLTPEIYITSERPHFSSLWV